MEHSESIAHKKVHIRLFGINSLSLGKLGLSLLLFSSSLAFIISVLVKLHKKSLEPAREYTIVALKDSSPVPFRLQSSTQNNVRLATANFIVKPEADYGAVKGLTLQFATYNHPISIQKATLQLLEDSSCEYVYKNTQIEDNSYVRFLAQEGCTVVMNKAHALNFTLKVISLSDAPIAVWSKKVVHSDSSATLLLDRDGNTQLLAPLLSFMPSISPQESSSAIDSLEFFWSSDNQKRGVKSFICLAILFILIALGNSFRSLVNTQISFRPMTLILSFSGFALLYAIICPPYQAPDEPDHIKGLLTNQFLYSLEQQLDTHMKKVNFLRIREDSLARFYPSDKKFKQSDPLPDWIEPTDMRYRSPLTHVIWTSFTKFSPPSSIPNLLLNLRLIAIFINTFWIFIAYKILVKEDQVDCLSRPLTCLITVPTLPFFAMHVSNYAYFVGTSIVGMLTFVWLLNNRLNLKIATLVGVNLALLLYSASAAIPILLFWAIFIIIHLSLFPSEDKDFMKGKLRFLHKPTMTLNASFWATILLFYNEVYRDNFKRALRGSFPENYFFISVFALSFFATLVIPRITLMITRLKLNKTLNAIPKLILIGMLLVILFAPFFKSYPPLLNIEVNPPPLSPTGYAWAVLKAFTISLNPFGPEDFYLQRSFWTGFGWLEFSLPRFFLKFFVTMPIIAIIIWILRSRKDHRPSFPAFFIICSLLLALVGTAFLNSREHANIHGRYLIGFYCLFIGYLSNQLFNSANEAHFKNPNIQGCLIICVIMSHSLSLYWLISRYFA